MKRSGLRLLFGIVAFCLVAPVVLGIGSVAAATEYRLEQERLVAPPLDIAAIALRSTDLSADGYFSGTNALNSLEDIAAEKGVSVEEVRAAGYGRRYFGHLGMPPSGDSECMGQVVSTWVYENTDVERAARQFEETIELFEEENAPMIDDDVEIGDDAFLVEFGIRDSPCDPTAPEGEGMQLVFQLDRLVVHVWVFNNEHPEEVPAGALPVDAGTLIELGMIAEAKTYAVLEAAAGETLEPLVLRIGDGETVIGSTWDEYPRLQSMDVEYETETEQQRAERIARYGSATDVYHLLQRFPDEDGDEVIYINTLYRFGDDDVASEWLSESGDRLADDDRLADIEPVELAGDFGDETIAYTFVDTKVDVEFTRYYARFGDVVAVFSVGPANGSALEEAEMLVEAQAECFAIGYCPSAVPFPES